jgi:2,3-bisphosphoglycerate-independent phosphoglycerate mutase
MGNSEVGHLNMGAGRIVGMDLPRITAAIQDGEFFKNRVFLDAMEHVKNNRSRLHLVGMVSPGGVHSLDEHLYALLGMARQEGLPEAYIHMFTDGRDTDERAALPTVMKMAERMHSLGIGQVATVAGRFYAMDRGNHWSQTALAYDAIVSGRGETAHSAEECIQRNYGARIFDEMIKPTVILDSGSRPVAQVADNDAVIFINFRSDRALQLARMFASPEAVPAEFRRPPLQNLYFATMTEYDQVLPAHAAFPPLDLKNNLAEVISGRGLAQFHIAESEKYAHVTAFFNGGRSEKLPGEERLIVTSPENNARNYADQPQMSAVRLTDQLVEKIAKTDTNFFVANFANGDMVGHTGNLAAAIRAVECLDGCIRRIRDAVLQADGLLLVTADHGNCEQMINVKNGEIDKDHTTSPVPLLAVGNEFKFSAPLGRRLSSLSSQIPAGVISDIAPTILDFFGIEKPAEMTGVSLAESLKSKD